MDIRIYRLAAIEKFTMMEKLDGEESQVSARALKLTNEFCYRFGLQQKWLKQKAERKGFPEELSNKAVIPKGNFFDWMRQRKRSIIAKRGAMNRL